MRQNQQDKILEAQRRMDEMQRNTTAGEVAEQITGKTTGQASARQAAGNADRFPMHLFWIYIFSFAGQAIFNTYINLYMSSLGFSTSQIGTVVSVSTVVLFASQIGLGILSDRVQIKNRVVQGLYLASALTAVAFYLSEQYWAVFALFTAFNAFFVPIMPLNDNITLQLLEKSRWDYGMVRMGGTIGYAVTVAVVGFVLRDQYGNIFWMTGVALLLCLLLSGRVQKVQLPKEEKKKVSYRDIIKNKNLIGLLVFNLAFTLGTVLFNNYYPIYFVTIGGDSGYVGMLMFVSAAAEVPCLFCIHKIVRRMGTVPMLALAGVVTAVRWFLMFFLHDPLLITLANALHGFGYTAFNYSIVNYINRKVPKELRASGQMFNILLGQVFSKCVFGYLGGFICQYLGGDVMMLWMGIVMVLATVVFVIWGMGRREELQFL